MPVHLDELKISVAFIELLRSASLDDEGLDDEVLQWLRNPLKEPLDVTDADLRLSIDLFLSVSNASQDTYSTTRDAIHRRHPADEVLSYDQIKRKITELSGVVTILHHMCPNSCVAYTGPFSELQHCPECGEARYDTAASGEKTPRQEFHTIPLGPQLQALWRTPASAHAMEHRKCRTEVIFNELEENDGSIDIYDDVYHGSEYIAAVMRGDITPNDKVLMFSIDGAQLYASKASDCWIYIWVILDLPPDIRYQKRYVLPGGFISGPNKPKHPDSYVFPGLYHLAALQREGLPIWNARTNTVTISYPYFALGTADGPGMSYLNGLVGHRGAYGCRLYCPVKGRRKPGAPTHYPAFLKPENYDVAGCDHDDINIRQLSQNSADEYTRNLAYVLTSRNNTQYKDRRKETGISKPSIFSGLLARQILGVPGCFALDLMHLASLNLTDLLINLWRGMLDCEKPDDKASWDWAVLKGDIWKEHGMIVAKATPYLPGSFDRPPRNPAEKISSGYKAWEFLMYIYGLGPGLFYRILPEKYWRHFCKLVIAMRLLHQRSITRDQLQKAHAFILDFVEDFELFYYQRKIERLHFCRPCLHTLPHLAPEVARVGPLVYYTQWTMERTIGNLGEEIKQPSKPYANLSQRGVRRSRVNALKAMIPDLQPVENKIPRGGRDLGGGYVLLRARDETVTIIDGAEGNAIRAYLENTTGRLAEPNSAVQISRWARLRLPNGQIARSAWKEKAKALEKVRMARNVKVCLYIVLLVTTNMCTQLLLESQIQFGEVQYYFRIDENRTAALVSLYSPPDVGLLESSYGAVCACTYQGEHGLQVVEVQVIQSVVAMVPLSRHNKDDADGQYFVVEKPGLDVAYLAGAEEADE